MAGKSGGFLGCARNKTEMLSIRGMRWYMATALECSSVVVDTMSWRGMVTHEKEANWGRETSYRDVIHRLDGPALECADGDKFWYVNGQKHRVDGPAAEDTSGNKAWYVDGKRHRLDGPAVEWYDGEREWWVFGVRQK